MNSKIFILALIFAGSGGSLYAQGSAAQQLATEPTVAEIGRVIAERERGNWREPIDYFTKFTPKPSSMNTRNVAVWDAYLQLRVETWFERSQQWKTPESVAADAERAVQAGREYFEWYGRLGELRNSIPKTPADSLYAKITAPGRIRFGLAIFGNALLELRRSREVLQEFATRPDDWFGEEAFRVWIAAAAAGYSGLSKNTLQRVQEEVAAGRVRAEDISAFSDKLETFLKKWKDVNSPTPLPPQWTSVRDELKLITRTPSPSPTPALPPRPPS
jgi:hypothetical protein